jgi:hypothetical protein
LSETGALPSGVTFVDNGDGTATLAGTPAATAGGSYSISITASNGVGSNATQIFTLVVKQPPAITSAALTTFTVGTPGTFTVTTTGYPVPTLSAGGASLPVGVTFVDNGNGTATLSGTPLAGSGGSYALSFDAGNGSGPDAVQSFTLTVHEAPYFTTADNATFISGQQDAFSVGAHAFPDPTLTETGPLPAGISFVDNGNGNGSITGNAPLGTDGVFTFTLTASNGVGGNATQTFTLTIDQAPAITSPTAATFTVASAGTFTVTSTGYPISVLELGGAQLPAGISFVDNGDGTGTLSGTPALGTVGSNALTFTATNGVGSGAVQDFTLTVGQAGTGTGTTVVTGTVIVGQPANLAATVTATPPAGGTATGTILFEDAGVAIPGCTADALDGGGNATCTTAFANVGTHPIAAIYSGDGNFSGSTSVPANEVVDPANTTTVLTSSANPAVTGQSITETATVARVSPGAGTAGGTVTFSDGGTPITACIAVATVNGAATCTVTYTGVGTHVITASFSPDANDLASTALAISQNVVRATTTTTVSSTPNPSAQGEMVAITITVKAVAPASGNPTGTVTLSVDGKAFGIYALDSTVDSRALVTTTVLATGTHILTATYSGDANFVTSASTDSPQVVELALTVPSTGAPSGFTGGLLGGMVLLLAGGLLSLEARKHRM